MGEYRWFCIALVYLLCIQDARASSQEAIMARLVSAEKKLSELGVVKGELQKTVDDFEAARAEILSAAKLKGEYTGLTNSESEDQKEQLKNFTDKIKVESHGIF